MHLKPCHAPAHHNVGGGVSLREHIFDLPAGADVPLRHAVGEHGLNPVVLQSFSLTDGLHDGEGFLLIESHVNKVGHDIIPTTDGGGNLRLPGLDQRLGVAEPHVRSVGQTGNTHQIRETLRVRIF